MSTTNRGREPPRLNIVTVSSLREKHKRKAVQLTFRPHGQNNSNPYKILLSQKLKIFILYACCFQTTIFVFENNTMKTITTIYLSFWFSTAPDHHNRSTVFCKLHPNTWLSGWDTLHPEWNFSLAFERIFNGVWRTDQDSELLLFNLTWQIYQE